MYDAELFTQSNNATIDTTDERCVIATFSLGTDIEQSTLGVVNANGTRNAANVGNPAASAPLHLTKVAAVAGATTAPDLVGTTVDPGASPPQITYTFDQNLDPSCPLGVSRWLTTTVSGLVRKSLDV